MSYTYKSNPLKTNVCYDSVNKWQYRENIFLGFSSNSEAFASRLLEYLEELLSQYCMHSDMFEIFKYLTTQYCVICRERAKYLPSISRSLSVI